MHVRIAGFAALALVACGGHHGGDDGDDDGDDGGGDACVGLECQVVNCTQQNRPATTLTGTVHAPNGTLPLYGVNVYVPRDTPLPPLPEGVRCSRCSDELPGSPLARVQTDEAGRFRLENVPSGDRIPLVITTGKWRRQLVISRVEECTETAVPDLDTRLPRNHGEGDIPRIAITTGRADALECLMRKIGIDDAEITPATGTGRIHLYVGNGASRIGAAPLSNAQTLWEDPAKLRGYDISVFSCEGGQHAETKSQAAMDAVKGYADLGGRLFMSHWHNIWIEGATTPATTPPRNPPVWPAIASFNNSGTTFGNENDFIDEASNPKGAAFASWMLNVMGSTARDQILIGTGPSGGTGKNTVQTIDPVKAERWVYWKSGGVELPQNFQFTTPSEVPSGERCGKVVFSDMHVSGDSQSSSGTPFPGQCSTMGLTPQEKALAFMFFDIASCVGPIL